MKNRVFQSLFGTSFVKRYGLRLALLLGFFVVGMGISPRISEAACGDVPDPAKGTSTTSVNIPTTGNYNIWSRVLAPDSTNNSFFLRVDSSCVYKVGDNAAIPANTWTWVNYQDGSTGSVIRANLSAGQHQVVMTGHEPNVGVDRVLFLSDLTCVPTGNGDNCTPAAPPPDTTAPTVSITSPAVNSTVSGANVQIAANATDSVGVIGVQFKVDGNNLGVEDTSSPYSATWNTTGLPDGTHNVTAVARDAAGNTRTVTNTVTVDNPDTSLPSVSFTAPAAGATISGTYTAVANASDNTAVTRVEISLDGAIKVTDTTSPYNYTFDTRTLSNGSHTLSAKAYDAAGNNRTATVAFSVNNPDTTPPSVPANLRGTTPGPTAASLSWGASTDTGINASGISKYNVLRRSPGSNTFVVVAQPTATSFTDSTLAAGASYSYLVQAMDKAGNVSSNSNTVNVTTPSIPTPDSTPPTVPSSVAASAVSTTQIDIKWDESTDSGGSGLAGYNIYREGSKLNAALITSESYGDSGIDPGTTYSYQIEAVDGAGNKSPRSQPSSASTPAIVRGDVTGPTSAPDGKIDLRDISYLIRNYNGTSPSGDVSGPSGQPDGVVDIYDLSYVIRNYGK